MNVCGLKRRAQYPDFIDMVENYDLLCFTETKIDETDIISFPGYCNFSQPRKQSYQRKSGGISVYFRENLSKYIRHLQTESDYVLWIEIDKIFSKTDENVILGTIYIPPENSNYYNEDEFMILETEITSFCARNKYVLLTGDFNARTGELRDYTERDDFLSDFFDFDTDTSEFFFQASKLEAYDMPVSRKSLDKHTNNIGFRLLDICRNNNLFIFNGRAHKDRPFGNLTFRQKSVIDYTLATIDTFKFLHEFEIIETDPLFSDGHCLLSCKLCFSDFSATQSSKGQTGTDTTTPKWNDKYAHNFCNNVERDEIIQIIHFLDIPSPTKYDINHATDRISFLFNSACEKTFPASRRAGVISNKTKPWFGSHCKSARKKYHLARKQFNICRSRRNHENLIECSKQYKKTMNKYIAKQSKLTQNKLRNLQSKNPKQYWKFINSLKEKSIKTTPTLEEFYEHFKLQNLDFDQNSETLNLDNIDNNELLNAKITPEEIMRCINKLNNGKSPGPDHIMNEHIKSTCSIFLPLYEKLFNTILDTGHFPEQWSIGCIHPIYKNKGERNDVKNYRPITILSCLGKLFTSILNLRLNEYLEENFLLSENQAGFRRQYSTLDHIFTMHALTELLKCRKQKLFCCFVDFSSAFDSVWRTGLWYKLLQSNVNGKIFRVITNMYNDIKSCVSLVGNDSAFFTSVAGVRQGENLSPVMFSLYLNDLEQFLMHNTNAGVLIDCDSADITIFQKLIVLLYADDTVILATNENDLQYSLDRFHDYCRMWKLKINTDKTKILIFGARNTSSFHFTIGDEVVEITDKYKYLGVYFSQSRSFLNARKHIVEQSRKAMYLLFCRINNLDLPVDLQLKLFDHTVLPILTYACEIWGFENLDILEKIHTEFLRKITKCRKSTPLYMLYAELGRYPLNITIKTRMIGFWNRLLLGKQFKLAYIMYQTLKTTDERFKWISHIKQILTDVGRYDIWINQNALNSYNIKYTVKRILMDQFLQSWRSSLNNSSKGKNFNVFKDSIELEVYFKLLPTHLYVNMVRFRTGNHKMPIEIGRWNNIDIDQRKCLLCEKNSIGDEFHYLLECTFFKQARQSLVPYVYYNRPNILKFQELLRTHDERCIINLSKFMGIIIKHFS
ncbi:MAG: reverse transcriptase family protein [Candidatus Thiodiazotropha sp.]